MKFIKDFIDDLKNDKLLALVFAICVALFIYVGFFKKSNKNDAFDNSKPFAELFYTKSCPHCQEALKFIDNSLKIEFPEVSIHSYELSSPEMPKERRDFFNNFSTENKITAVPVFIFKDKFLIGYDNEKTSGNNYRNLLSGKEVDVKLSGLTCEYGEDEKTGDCLMPSDFSTAFNDDGEIAKAQPSRIINIPLIGEIDVFKESILFLSVSMGLVDGFNPCAMWVLVFMISVIVRLNSKSKIWLIVGSFLFASTIFYYALLAGWINLFKIIGYVELLNVFIGCVAIYTGFASIKSFLMGHIVCKVVDAETSKSIKNRIVALAERPIGIGMIFGVIALAFVVNGIEFVCSAALPAIFTSVLAFSHLSTTMHYWYITVYVFFFMLDDLIVFSLAAFAVNKYNGDKYMEWCKLIGGLIIFILGIMLLFFPTYLR